MREDACKLVIRAQCERSVECGFVPEDHFADCYDFGIELCCERNGTCHTVAGFTDGDVNACVDGLSALPCDVNATADECAVIYQ